MMRKCAKEFIERTVEHIHRVQKNMIFLVTNHQSTLGLSIADCKDCMHNVMVHDQSKFSPNLFDSYVEINNYYSERRKGNKNYKYPSGMKTKIDVAIKHHYQAENHHPEGLVERNERLTYAQMMEIVCDLQAMAQEFGEGNCRKYYEEVWKKKQIENFYNEIDWEITISFMNRVIKCFE
jgi:hypothetical protein